MITSSQKSILLLGIVFLVCLSTTNITTVNATPKAVTLQVQVSSIYYYHDNDPGLNGAGEMYVKIVVVYHDPYSGTTIPITTETTAQKKLSGSGTLTWNFNCAFYLAADYFYAGGWVIVTIVACEADAWPNADDEYPSIGIVIGDPYPGINSGWHSLYNNFAGECTYYGRQQLTG